MTSLFTFGSFLLLFLNSKTQNFTVWHVFNLLISRIWIKRRRKRKKWNDHHHHSFCLIIIQEFFKYVLLPTFNQNIRAYTPNYFKSCPISAKQSVLKKKNSVQKCFPDTVAIIFYSCVSHRLLELSRVYLCVSIQKLLNLNVAWYGQMDWLTVFGKFLWTK